MDVVLERIEKLRESAGSDQENSNNCCEEEQSKPMLVIMWTENNICN